MGGGGVGGVELVQVNPVRAERLKAPVGGGEQVRPAEMVVRNFGGQKNPVADARQSGRDQRFGSVRLRRVNKQGAGVQSLAQGRQVALVIKSSQTDLRDGDSGVAHWF